MSNLIKIGNLAIGGSEPFTLIAGPCVLESEHSAFYLAEIIKDMSRRYNINFIFKASYDKANRSSLSSFRGPGIKKGLKILKKIKKAFKVPILSDVHCQDEVKEAKEILDIIQIPAFLCRQTDLILRIAHSKRVVNIKKGQFLAPWDVGSIIEKIESAGNKKILITERGTTFGYNNLVVDFRSLAIMRKFGYPIIFDATHSVQLPGAGGSCSGGNREFIADFCRAAIAFGCDGLFLEVHKQPERALCDGANSVSLKELEEILKTVKEIDQVILARKIR